MSENINENMNENINENINETMNESINEELEVASLEEAENADPNTDAENSDETEIEEENSDTEIISEAEITEATSDTENVSEEEITDATSDIESINDDVTADSENTDSPEKPAKTKKAKPEEPLIELTEEEKKKIFSNTEAILFALGNSVQISKLCEVFEINERSLMPVLEEMQQKYEDEERGIEMIFLEGSVQLGTKKETYECLTKIAKIPAKYTLTDTVLETLSIIAYKQPVTRAEIEKIRGVSCDHAISKLIEFDLIEDVGRLEAPGHPLLFGTTEQFLRSFGVKSIGDLPAISPELVEDFKHQAENEAYGKPEGEDGDDTDALIGDGDVNPEDEEPTIVEV